MVIGKPYLILMFDAHAHHIAHLVHSHHLSAASLKKRAQQNQSSTTMKEPLYLYLSPFGLRCKKDIA
jgi:hypothetical protein